MENGIETLFTAALGLKAPWVVTQVQLDIEKQRIDFQVACEQKHMNCPVCSAGNQPVHDRMNRDWRHLDFFQYEAWLHADVPRVKCDPCGKTTQVDVPWARPDSGFTLLFEAFSLTLCQTMPVAKAAKQLRVESKRLWRRITHYVGQARAKEEMAGVSVIGIDETSCKRGHEYVTVVHDLDAKRLLFITPGRTHETVEQFKADMVAHGGDPEKIKHVCMDMGPAYIKGVSEQLPKAEISFDRFHVIALANEAMTEVRREEMRGDAKSVRAAMGGDKEKVKGLRWSLLKKPINWTEKQMGVMYLFQRSKLKSARAWRLKEGLREVYALSVESNCPKKAESLLLDWISWARRSRLEPFKRLGATIKGHLDGVVRGMLDGRSNAYVEAMNSMLQQTKIAARGFRDLKNFMAIAYLRMGKLKHLPANPFGRAT